jgi:hypothetical protein
VDNAMTTYAVQYLGSRPKDVTPEQVRERLREACQRLPISMVLLDWDLPPQLEAAVAEETAIQNAELYRWQTWQTADSRSPVPPEWAVVSLDGYPVPGYADDPDFTFFCPNHPGVAEYQAKRLQAIAKRGLYSGIFLDRIRFPSPTIDPAAHLGCFCKYCSRAALEAGLDLGLVRRYVNSLLIDEAGARHFASSLLGNPETPAVPLEAFLDFREQVISRVVESVASIADSFRLRVGLDCFTPSLSRMVGQNLTDLNDYADWIKLMIYPRVFGPAGISYEFLNLAKWLQARGVSETKALKCIRDASQLPVPAKKAELAKNGMGADAMATEIRRGRGRGITQLLAGLAMVEVKDVHESTAEQIRQDLKASRDANGLVLSWDLWQIPLDRLDSIRRQGEKQ